MVRGLYLYGAKTVQPKSLAKMIVSVDSSVVIEDDSTDTTTDTETTTPESSSTGG